MSSQIRLLTKTNLKKHRHKNIVYLKTEILLRLMDRAATISQTMEQIDLSDQTAIDNYSFDSSFDSIRNRLDFCVCIVSAFSF